MMETKSHTQKKSPQGTKKEPNNKKKSKREIKEEIKALWNLFCFIKLLWDSERRRIRSAVKEECT